MTVEPPSPQKEYNKKHTVQDRTNLSLAVGRPAQTQLRCVAHHRDPIIVSEFRARRNEFRGKQTHPGDAIDPPLLGDHIRGARVIGKAGVIAVFVRVNDMIRTCTHPYR